MYETHIATYNTLVMDAPSAVPALIITGGYGNTRKKRDTPDSVDIIGYYVQTVQKNAKLRSFSTSYT